MYRKPKFTHLFPSDSRRPGYQKAACGAMVKNGLGGALSEAKETAAFCERNAAWMSPLCPKCAAAALIAETVAV